jgi:hypothetical protein
MLYKESHTYSSSKIISDSMRSMQVEGEYCLSTNKHLIQGKIASEAFAKIHAALFFTAPPLEPLGGVDDEPKTPHTRTP